MRQLLIFLVLLIGCATEHHIVLVDKNEAKMIWGPPIRARCERCQQNFVFPCGINGPVELEEDYDKRYKG